MSTFHAFIQYSFRTTGTFSVGIRILFMSNPLNDLAGVFKEISSFGLFSGYNINVTKSEALRLGPPGAGDIGFGEALNVKIATDHITYLGIKIRKNPDALYSQNFTPLIDSICVDPRWSRLPLSLPRLLYPMQTLPLLLKYKDIGR